MGSSPASRHAARAAIPTRPKLSARCRPSSWPRAAGAGVGHALMAAALADLSERGYAEATGWSFAANERANAFYASEGFEPDGAERTEETWAHIAEVRYRRALA